MIDFSSLASKAQAHLANISKEVSGILPNEIKKWKFKTQDESKNALPVLHSHKNFRLKVRNTLSLNFY